jgi:type II secretion system protein I
MPKCRRSSRCGSHASAGARAFSLFEVLLALTIFSIAIVAIAEGITVHLRAERLAEETTRAALLAQNILAEIRYAESFDLTTESGELDGEDAGFAWEYETSATDIDGLYRIRIVIVWSDGLARQTYETETLVAERGEEETEEAS